MTYRSKTLKMYVLAFSGFLAIYATLNSDIVTSSEQNIYAWLIEFDELRISE